MTSLAATLGDAGPNEAGGQRETGKHKRDIFVKRMKRLLHFGFPILVAGCFLQPKKLYYDVDLSGTWFSSDSLVSCGSPGPRTYLDFESGEKFELVTRFPSHVAVMAGKFNQDKATLRIDWDTATGCWTKDCNVSERVLERCGRANDTAVIERSGKIRLRDMLYSKWQ